MTSHVAPKLRQDKFLLFCLPWHVRSQFPKVAPPALKGELLTPGPSGSAISCCFKLPALGCFITKAPGNKHPTQTSQEREISQKHMHNLGVSQWLSGKKLSVNVRDAYLIPGLGRSPREGNGNPLQYSCLENSTDRGPLQGRKDLDTTKQQLRRSCLIEYTLVI